MCVCLVLFCADHMLSLVNIIDVMIMMTADTFMGKYWYSSGDHSLSFISIWIAFPDFQMHNFCKLSWRTRFRSKQKYCVHLPLNTDFVVCFPPPPQPPTEFGRQSCLEFVIQHDVDGEDCHLHYHYHYFHELQNFSSQVM